MLTLLLSVLKLVLATLLVGSQMFAGHANGGNRRPPAPVRRGSKGFTVESTPAAAAGFRSASFATMDTSFNLDPPDDDDDNDDELAPRSAAWRSSAARWRRRLAGLALESGASNG